MGEGNLLGTAKLQLILNFASQRDNNDCSMS